jgi:hypothetical protein
MYDQPILGGYEQALQLSGSPRAPIYTFNGTSTGAPAFPSGAPTGTLSVQSPWAVNSDFVVARTWQANAQFEHSFRARLHRVDRWHLYRGDHLPVVTNINPINPIGTLADGRPIFNTSASAADTPRSAFQSHSRSAVGRRFNLQIDDPAASKRFARGFSFNVQYAFGKGLDNTPLLTQLTVQSEAGRSDPTNIDRDRGPNPLDLRHSFTGNIVYLTSSNSKNAVVRSLLSGNQIGVLLQFNSGLPVNLPTNARDLNGDGVGADRPLFVARNSLYMPVRKNVDLRYTRMVPIRGSVRAEVIAELKNVFNTEQLQSITSTITVDTLAIP